MSENTVNAALRRLGFTKNEMTGHGFRSAASSMLNESGLWNADAIERQLAHADSDSVRRAYARADFWKERVSMMNWWADKCDEMRSGGTIVITRVLAEVSLARPRKSPSVSENAEGCGRSMSLCASARQAHNLKVVGSNPAPATILEDCNFKRKRTAARRFFVCSGLFRGSSNPSDRFSACAKSYQFVCQSSVAIAIGSTPHRRLMKRPLCSRCVPPLRREKSSLAKLLAYGHLGRGGKWQSARMTTRLTIQILITFRWLKATRIFLRAAVTSPLSNVTFCWPITLHPVTWLAMQALPFDCSSSSQRSLWTA